LEKFRQIAKQKFKNSKNKVILEVSIGRSGGGGIK
jgi:hypothetical protein